MTPKSLLPTIVGLTLLFGACGATVDDTSTGGVGGGANTGIVPGTVGDGAETPAAAEPSPANTGLVPGATDADAETAAAIETPPNTGIVPGTSDSDAEMPVEVTTVDDPAAGAAEDVTAPATEAVSSATPTSDATAPAISGVNAAAVDALRSALAASPHSGIGAVALAAPPADQPLPSEASSRVEVAPGTLWLYAKLAKPAADDASTSEAYWQAEVLAERLSHEGGASAPFGFEVQQPNGEVLLGGVLTETGTGLVVPTEETFTASQRAVSGLGVTVERAGDAMPVFRARVASAKDVPALVGEVRRLVSAPYLLEARDATGGVVFAQGVTGGSGAYMWKHPSLRG